MRKLKDEWTMEPVKFESYYCENTINKLARDFKESIDKDTIDSLKYSQMNLEYFKLNFIIDKDGIAFFEKDKKIVNLPDELFKMEL